MMNDSKMIIGDKNYQQKTVQAIMQDTSFAEQISDVMKPEYFDQEYLSCIVRELFTFKMKYNSFPSDDILKDILKKNDVSELISSQAMTFLDVSRKTPLNGDMSYIQETSLDFCRKIEIQKAMIKALDQLDKNNFDGTVKIIMDSAARGATRDIGHEYMDGFSYRGEKSIRCPLVTPWPVLTKLFGGGWERKTLSTFIAPTGAGKTHFLCNVSAGGIESGYNAVYVTMEIPDYKIGLRHDAYFSTVPINDVPDEMERVEKEVRSAVKGRLFIKEYPTKMASVQTIRSYLRRLKTIHNFVPDILVVDYADLLRSSKSYGDKRHELEGIYEELRGLAQEWNIVVITADQTNRSGLNAEIVTLDAISESYAKATVCDLIMTVSRKLEDKSTNSGRIFIAKSRLGPDGIVYPFLMNPALVKVRIMDQQELPEDIMKKSEKTQLEDMKNRYKELCNKEVE